MGIWQDYWSRRLFGASKAPVFRAKWVSEDSRGSIRATSNHPLFRDFMWSWNGGDGVRVWYRGRAFAWLDLSYGGLYEIRPNFMDEGEFRIFLELVYENVRSVKDIRKIRHFKPEYDEETMQNDREAPADQEPEYWDKDYSDSDWRGPPLQVETYDSDEFEEDWDDDDIDDYEDEEFEDPDYEEDWDDDDIDDYEDEEFEDGL